MGETYAVEHAASDMNPIYWTDPLASIKIRIAHIIVGCSCLKTGFREPYLV